MIRVIDPRTGTIVDEISENDEQKKMMYARAGFTLVHYTNKQPPQRTFTPQGGWQEPQPIEEAFPQNYPEGQQSRQQGQEEEETQPQEEENLEETGKDMDKTGEGAEKTGEDLGDTGIEKPSLKQRISNLVQKLKEKQLQQGKQQGEKPRPNFYEQNLDTQDLVSVGSTITKPPDEHNFTSPQTLLEQEIKGLSPNEIQVRAWSSTSYNQFLNPPEPISPSEYWIEKAGDTENKYLQFGYGLLSSGFGLLEATFIDPFGSMIETGKTVKNLVSDKNFRSEMKDFLTSPVGLGLLTGTIASFPAMFKGFGALRTENVGEYKIFSARGVLETGEKKINVDIKATKIDLPEKELSSIRILGEKGDVLFSKTETKIKGGKTETSITKTPIDIKGLDIKELGFEKGKYTYKGKPKLLEEEVPEIYYSETKRFVSPEGKGLEVREFGEYKGTGLIIPEESLGYGKIGIISDDKYYGALLELPREGKRKLVVSNNVKTILSSETPKGSWLDRLIGLDDYYERKTLVHIKNEDQIIPQVTKEKSLIPREIRELENKIKKTSAKEEKNIVETIQKPLEKIEEELGRPQARYRSITKPARPIGEIAGTGSLSSSFIRNIIGKTSFETGQKTVETGIKGVKEGKNMLPKGWSEPKPLENIITQTGQGTKNITKSGSGITVVPRGWVEPKPLDRPFDKVVGRQPIRISPQPPPPNVKQPVFTPTKGGIDVTRIPVIKFFQPPMGGTGQPIIPKTTGGTKGGIDIKFNIIEKTESAQLTKELLENPFSKPPRYNVKTSRKGVPVKLKVVKGKHGSKKSKKLFVWEVKYKKVDWEEAIKNVFK